MRSWGFRHAALGICAAAILAGCGGLEPPIGAPREMQATNLHRVLPASYYQVLYRFRYRGEHGRQPQASLINVNGTLYGTTTIGGSGCTYGCGTVFSVTTTGGRKVLYGFAGARYNDGAEPRANLINVNGTRPTVTAVARRR